ncbi:hypothetical protein V7S43_018900 [Phytophthora oleae]|uniref:Uncharacterized protein n=1 Tax=Phytophthora oleae TaxID=2107226 RepID=A0ABD3EPF3_9STRA
MPDEQDTVMSVSSTTISTARDASALDPPSGDDGSSASDGGSSSAPAPTSTTSANQTGVGAACPQGAR